MKPAWSGDIRPFFRGFGGRKRLIITVDVESDYGTGKFECLERGRDVLQFLQHELGIFTAFCEGNLLRIHHPVIENLLKAGGEVELHCNDHHRNGPDDVGAFKKGLESYQAYFGCLPKGYRAGNYRMTAALFEAVQKEGLAWDSSLLPVFDSRDYRVPFVANEGVVEFPATVLFGAYPFCMSYYSLVYPALCGMTKTIVRNLDYVNFTIHFHDLMPAGSLKRARIRNRLLFNWNYRFGWVNPLQIFTKIVYDLLESGFEPCSLGQLYKEGRSGTGSAGVVAAEDDQHFSRK